LYESLWQRHNIIIIMTAVYVHEINLTYWIF